MRKLNAHTIVMKKKRWIIGRYIGM